MRTFSVITATLSAALATAGTVTLDYPDGKSRADFVGGYDHKLVVLNGGEYTAPKDFTLTFNASDITLTWKASNTIAADKVLYVQVDEPGADEAVSGVIADEASLMSLVRLDLGNPIAPDADGVVASQAATAADGLATGINGALADGGVATFDVPRNVVAAWTNAAVITVTGADNDGNVMVESSASGTSFTGKKAFKTVTDISVSADVTGLTVGTGKVLGLPVFLPSAAYVLAELEDEAAPTAGTIAAGATAEPSATTGDVRGTYAPNGTPDGSKAFALVCALSDPNYRGGGQYAG